MKFVFVSFIVFSVTFGVDSSSFSSVGVTNKSLNVNATASVKVPVEKIWNGLSKVHRYPIINSGDTIALRSAFTSGSRSQEWFGCGRRLCFIYTCHGLTIANSKWWSSCNYGRRGVFTIFAKGKMNGQPIDSGDTVSLSSNRYGISYRLYCTASTNTYCCVRYLTWSMTGSEWLKYSQATFQIFSKNAEDGSPVQYGDVVGFKYPYSTNSAWLTNYKGRFYPRNCSCCSKSSCAAENTNTGFKIFKKLP